MLFNSFSFLVFFVIVFSLYWFVFKTHNRYQNLLLLISSYVFYGWWDWRFLSLILFSTIVDFYVGHALGLTIKKKHRRFLLGVSICVNIGLLGFFKYYNFFIDNWVEVWSSLGITMHRSTLQIILPVGISFYTFQTLSYTIDIYRDKINPEKSVINFATFVAFFPQLVAGPIERAKNLLPQFSIQKKFCYKKAMSGLHLIIWGLFKKVVIADTCATYVNVIFDNYEQMNTLSLVLGAVYFAFQIYGDFSGYSDIAVGLSRLLGFDLMRNFNYPYFSRDIAEFWRRWHISLSTWFRDYVYIPLGGSRVSKIKQVRNVFVIFLVSGFWHGANWTFIVWGALNAVYFLPLLLLSRNRNYLDDISISKSFMGLKTIVNIALTFMLTCLAWVFFRSNTVSDAVLYIKQIFLRNDFSSQFLSIERYNFEALLLVLLFVVIEWLIRHYEHPFLGKYATIKSIGIVFLIIILGVYSNHNDFIYFQF
ncbi:MBOAT family O-acyltransferase [Ichthyenterobacterium magnum]|uniref:D-alanyl-lipoteichoic acid acyltransferase DltB (MBOAT superfamily) n=1 Tax=Ichthyenterobacterium magnum TaxID=1230530 RepID=A0A420DV22_9FLAO|nr:MBOAT family O-acyltransferase [Ichthyenterobacterium magnum]RKE97977.1 D-alanyl-lipoteichoic acid acyltransferase DltB (MBOAT superfamily) [Ichthyenterobacterium magnum]